MPTQKKKRKTRKKTMAARVKAIVQMALDHLSSVHSYSHYDTGSSSTLLRSPMRRRIRMGHLVVEEEKG